MGYIGITFVGSNFFVNKFVISSNYGGTKSTKSFLNHLSNNYEEFKFFISSGGGGFIFFSKGSTHFSREI